MSLSMDESNLFITNLMYDIIQCKRGDIAQLGERCVRIAEVGGSNPPISKNG